MESDPLQELKQLMARAKATSFKSTDTGIVPDPDYLVRVHNRDLSELFRKTEAYDKIMALPLAWLINQGNPAGEEIGFVTVETKDRMDLGEVQCFRIVPVANGEK